MSKPHDDLAAVGSLPRDRAIRTVGLALLASTLLVGTMVLLPEVPGRINLPLRSVVIGFGRKGEHQTEAAISSDGSSSASSMGSGGTAASSRTGTSSLASRSATVPALEQPIQVMGEEQQTDQTETWLRSMARWPEGEAFHAPESRCTVQPDGSVAYNPAPSPATGMPFLFDVAQFGSKAFREHMCGEGIDNRYTGRYRCFGPCIFESRLCDLRYPGANKSQAVVEMYQAAGWRFGDLSPCEFFQRIRGRTLWFMGDSQTCHFYYAAECFLREFAPRMNRTAPFPREINEQFSTHDPPIYPKCFALVHNTRVCQLRVDDGRTIVGHVLPLMLKHNPDFANDIMLFNFGLHYGTLGSQGFLEDIASVIRWRQERRRHQRPLMVWMDVPMQHFDSKTGKFNRTMMKDKGNMECKNLTSWYEGEPSVVAGGSKNMLAAPHIPAMADAHLRTWNASAPLWDVHMPGECTHYCSPTAYHIWLYLLNRELAESRVGAKVRVRRAKPEGRASGARAAAAEAGPGAGAAAQGAAATAAAAAAAAAAVATGAGSAATDGVR